MLYLYSYLNYIIIVNCLVLSSRLISLFFKCRQLGEFKLQFNNGKQQKTNMFGVKSYII